MRLATERNRGKSKGHKVKGILVDSLGNRELAVTGGDASDYTRIKKTGKKGRAGIGPPVVKNRKRERTRKQILNAWTRTLLANSRFNARRSIVISCANSHKDIRSAYHYQDISK